MVDTFDMPLENHKLPKWLIVFAGIFTSYAEFICGILLVLGLFKSFALYLLGLDLLMVCFAFSVMKPMWDMQFVFPRVVLLVLLLIIPAGWDVLSLDHFFKLTELIKPELIQ